MFGGSNDRLRARFQDALDGWQKAVEYGTKRDQELETARKEMVKLAAQIADRDHKIEDEKDKVASLRAVIFGRLRHEKSRCADGEPILVTRAEYDAIMEWKIMGARFITPEPEQMFFEGKAIRIVKEASS